MQRSGALRQLPAPPPTTAPELPPLRTAQNACYEALGLALKEGHVFAALTGPEGSGKTTVLEAVLADRRDRALRCIRIADPDKVPAALADHIEQVAYAEAGKPENLGRHVVLAVDDAHTASVELLTCLSRLAAMREPGRRIPQVLLVGRPELWNRLAEDGFEPLARRLAIRAALPAAEDDSDPWAVVESDVSQTMTMLRAEAERSPSIVLRPGEPDDMHDGMSEPEHRFSGAYARSAFALEDEPTSQPNLFALFADPPPAARSAQRWSSRRRLLLPLLSLFVGLAAFAVALSFYDWPDLLGDMPWSEPKASVPFVMPRSPQASSFGLPLPPSAAPPTKPVAPRSPAPATPEPAPPSLAEPAPLPQSPPAPTVAAAPQTTPETAVAAPSAPVPVVVPQAAPPATASAAVTTPTAAPATRAAAEAPLSPVLLALLLRRGDEQVAIGDISAARLLYERAAEAGSALAAHQLARTYDPAYLPSSAEGSLADPARARSWYRRAASLGNRDAAARLKALDQGR